jgi:hypothetical protein
MNILEGLIQLPSKLLAEISSFATYWYLCDIKNFIEEEYTGKAYSKYQQLLQTAVKRHGAQELDDDDSCSIDELVMKARPKVKKIKIDLSDMPKRYLDKLAKDHNLDIDRLYQLLRKEDLTIELYFKAPSSLKTARAQYHPVRQSITIALDRFRDDLSLELQLTQGLDSLLGTVEHELTHAVQHMLLSKLDLNQITRSDDSKDSYFQSNIEFDPWVKTAVAQLKSAVRQYDASDRKLVLDYAFGIRDTNELQQAGLKSVRKFFMALRADSELRWKKAIKLTTTELERRLA